MGSLFCKANSSPQNLAISQNVAILLLFYILWNNSIKLKLARYPIRVIYNPFSQLPLVLLFALVKRCSATVKNVYQVLLCIVPVARPLPSSVLA